MARQQTFNFLIFLTFSFSCVLSQSEKEGILYDDDYENILINDENEYITRSKRLPALQRPDLEPLENLSSTVYIEIQIVVDRSIYLAQNSSESGIRKYFEEYIHSVAQRFKPLENPKIELYISEIKIHREKSVKSLENYLYPNSTRDNLRRLPAFNHLRRICYEENKKTNSSPDVILAFTKHYLCENSTCKTRTSGLSIVGGCCEGPDHETKAVNNLILVQDRGVFESVLVTAHEIGHILSVPHDGEAALESFKGPGAKNCSEEEGYIMAPKLNFKKTSRAHHWSNCSKSQLNYYLRTKRTGCLRNRPAGFQTSNAVPLPGKVLSLDDQCRLYYGGESRACKKRKRTKLFPCGHLYCYIKKRKICRNTFRPAADGLPCGDGKMCFFGECIPDQQI